MPQYTNLSQGTPFWVDLESTDKEASMSFYARVFGWEYDEAPPEEVGGMRYAWAKNSTGYPAGIYQEQEKTTESGQRPTWKMQILVDDMADVVGRVESCGGSIVVEPAQVGEYGISAVVAEPNGYGVTLWQPIQTGPTIKHEHGAMQWCELMTEDPRKTSQFFQELLGVRTEPMRMPDGSENSIVITEDGAVMSISALSGLSDELVARAGGSMLVVYFNVDDVDAAVERAVANGAELPDPPWDVPGIGRMAWIYDPQGALTALITPPSA